MCYGQAMAELLLTNWLHQTTQFYCRFSVLSPMPKKKRLSCCQNTANWWSLMVWGYEDPFSFYLNACSGRVWCRDRECKKQKLCYGTASKKDLCPAFCHECSIVLAVPLALPVFWGSFCTLAQWLCVLFPQTFIPHYTTSEPENATRDQLLVFYCTGVSHTSTSKEARQMWFLPPVDHSLPCYAVCRCLLSPEIFSF